MPDEAPGLYISPSDPGSPVLGGLEGASEVLQIPGRWLASKLFPASEDPTASLVGITPQKLEGISGPLGSMLAGAGLPTNAAIPIESALKTGAGALQFFSSPQGITETLAAIPAAPAMMAKWGSDVAMGIPQSIGNAWESYKQNNVQGVSDAIANAVGQGVALRQVMKGPANALHTETAQPIRGMRPRYEAEQVGGQMPTEGSVPQVGSRGGETLIEPRPQRTPEQIRSEVPLIDQMIGARSGFDAVKAQAQQLFPDIEVKEAPRNVGIEISHDGKTLNVSPQILDDLKAEYGPKAPQAFEKLVGEEITHNRHIQKLGPEFRERLADAWENAPDDIKGLVKTIYGNQFGMEPRHWGAEMLRMADQAKNTGDITESMHRWNAATPESIGKLADWAKSQTGEMADLLTPEPPKGSLLSEVTKMSPGEYFNKSEEWQRGLMAGEPGAAGVQVRAEQAAMAHPDRAAWVRGLEKATAEADKIKAEIRANPKSMMERQREMAGSAFKKQFFNEGLKIIDGLKEPEALATAPELELVK